MVLKTFVQFDTLQRLGLSFSVSWSNKPTIWNKEQFMLTKIGMRSQSEKYIRIYMA